MPDRHHSRLPASLSTRSTLFPLVGLTFFHATNDECRPFHSLLPAGAAVRINAHLLRPTQCVIGFREVEAKREKIEKQSSKKRTAYLKKKNVPLVIGPGGAAWMVDGHHTLRGLLDADVEDKTAYGRIISNWSDLPVSEFWRRMRANNYVYLKLPGGRATIPPARLPASLLQMVDDPHRSLAWAVGKAGGYEVQDDVFYQKFQWSEFFRLRVEWDDSSKKDFARAVTEATVLARTRAAARLPGWLATIPADVDNITSDVLDSLFGDTAPNPLVA
ncbi:ParB-like protein [Geminisphaera colitermitum]|uniref:ParB-like protein n=1 Tax=Geminisphaera colitermitum TaxID=1148786 RepID=UPI000158C68C|nr:ParB-like protein [Geminisphaera colitermitum]